MTSEQPYAQPGYDLMGAAFEVHREIGGGLAEEIPRHELLVFYKGKQLKRRYIPDLVVVDGIVVELNSVKSILVEHEAQLINYMRISRRQVGYLINFGPLDEVEWKRFVLTDTFEK